MISKRVQQIFERAKSCAQETKRIDAALLNAIEEVDRGRVFIAYGCTSLYRFCIDRLELPDSVTFNLINVLRASRKAPDLKVAVERGLPLTKARRIAPVITAQNQTEWIQKARDLPKDQLEAEVAAVNPRLIERERVKHTARGRREINFYTSDQRYEALNRARDVVSGMLGAPADLDQTIATAIEFLLSKKDQLARARRNQRRKNASVKTKVAARDEGSCQMKMPGGDRCGNRRFLHIHHKRARFHGGIDHPDNLITLCSGCHREWHRRHGDVPGP